MSDAQGVFFVTVIHLDLPTVEIDLQQRMSEAARDGGAQIGKVAFQYLPKLLNQIGRNSRARPVGTGRE